MPYIEMVSRTTWVCTHVVLLRVAMSQAQIGVANKRKTEQNLLAGFCLGCLL